MITPQFSVRQDENRIYIDIRTLHIRSAGRSMEFTVESDLFVFALNPYYLRLRFPGKLLSDEDQKAVEDDSLKSITSYDASKSIIHISICKETPGQHFEDLDLVTKLLARTSNIANQPDNDQDMSEEQIKDKIKELTVSGASNPNQAKPLIQEIDDNLDTSKISAADIDQHFAKIVEEGEPFNWEIEQKDPGRIEDIPNSRTSDNVLGHLTDISSGPASNTDPDQKPGFYGFNRIYNSVISVSIASGSNDVNDVVNPETSTPISRHRARYELEAMAFDSDYYLSDTFEAPIDLDEILEWKSPANISYGKLLQNPETKKTPALETENDISFTTKEKDYMTRISQEKGITTGNTDIHTVEMYKSKVTNPKRLYIGLIALIFASCYEERTNTGDPTVESAWTIAKICPLFSALDDEFNSVDEVVCACSRRALSFPLLRNWKLVGEIVFAKDVYQILRLGRRRILRVLLRIKEILEGAGSNGGDGISSAQYYVYSRLWIDDYVTWLQVTDANATDAVIRSMAHELHKIDFTDNALPSNVLFQENGKFSMVGPASNGKVSGKSLVALELYELEEAAKEVLAEQEQATES